jgi:branched-subunit amino acid aminotransferase/4-amino-4-deoxychorismate lyase
MLARKRVNEGIARVDELKQAEAIFLINSVRGWIPAKLES